jgi:hypothetical protein
LEDIWAGGISGRSSPVQKELFQGVKYLRLPGKSLRMFVAHLLFIDLRATNLSFFVTPADLDTLPSMRASTVTQFLERHQLQVAINANFFHPFHSNNPWDFYPRTGDIVQVLGIAASEGRQYSTQVWAGATAYISKSNRVQIGGGSDNFWNAVAGDQWLVRDGMNVGVSDTFGRYPRAAIGVNRTGDKSILAVVDGKQPGYSEGLTLPEFAELLLAHGAHNALNLDGGGSVTMVAADVKGRPVTLNSPIHTRIPGRQRPIANHLGITAEALK